MKLSDYCLDRIASAGVRDVFLVPGGAAMHLNDSLAKSRIHFVATFHEHASAVAAEAYAKLTNNLGVAMVTAGPGSTNAVTGVASAWVNSAPTVFLSGQVKSADLKGRSNLRQRGVQEIDIVSILKPITKYAVTVTEPETIRFHLERALHEARSDRPGPVWLSIPLDIQAATIEPERLQSFTPDSAGHNGSAGLRAQVSRVIALVNGSVRPVLLGGGGIRLSGAQEKFLWIAERLGVPVQTTWSGIDLMAQDHPLFVGRPGSIASRAANFAVQNCDLLLSVGARLDLATTGYSTRWFARGARRILVDIDPAELQKIEGPVDAAIRVGADLFLDELGKQLGSVDLRDRSPWFSQIREWVNRYPLLTKEHMCHENDTSTYLLIDQLSEMLDEGDIVVQGSSGIHSEIFFLVFRSKRGQRVIADHGFGAMGYGIPAAIGACVAAGRRTLLIDGDGSLQPNIQELETIRRLQLPIKLLVVNNGGYASIRASQQRYFQRLIAADPSSGLSFPPLDRIAEAYGIPYAYVAREKDLNRTLQNCLAASGPGICEVRVPADEDRVPRLASVQRPDGSMVSRPIEDLFPFLDREEFRSNMLIPPLEE
jgi:acetolactate synthase I/II/III large subunit